MFAIDNPEPNDDTRSYRAYDFSYPDGPHDAEAMLVDGRGRFYFVTKEVRGGIYRAPVNPSRTGVNELRRVGNAPAFVTDGTFLPDGEQIALRTYVSVEMLDADSYEVVAQAPLPLQPQGESITMDLDGDHLLVGSEGIRSKVYRIPVPTSDRGYPQPQRLAPADSDSDAFAHRRTGERGRHRRAGRPRESGRHPVGGRPGRRRGRLGRCGRDPARQAMTRAASEPFDDPVDAGA